MNLPWYLNRLSRMPVPEIPWRVVEALKKRSDKFGNFPSLGEKAPPHEAIFRLSKFLPSSQVFGFERHLSRLQILAERALDNHYSAFGLTPPANAPEFDWHLDPETHQRWPEKFWNDIDYRGTGSVKFVWEINRLHMLFPLALTYRITGTHVYAEKVVEIIHSWTAANPYPVGVNWASGIEAGIRMANLVWALSFLESYPLSESDRTAINDFVHYHARHLARFPSRFSSANNHLLAESFGLFLAGLYFPGLKGAQTWLRKGKTTLEKEAARQILPDGGSFEFSTTYLSFVLDFFLLFRTSCRSAGLSYDRIVDTRIETACDFIHSLLDKKGNIPNIGDQDSAVLVQFGLTNKENFSSLLNTGAVLFQRDDLFTGNQDLKTFILTGAKNVAAHGPLPYDQKEAPRSSCARIHLHSHSGLSVIRDRFQGKEILFTGNATPLGLAPLHAHGHLDALSFTLSVEGLEIFVDPGTYRYQDKAPWRQYFRSTAAHNTLRLDNRDQARQLGNFMFGSPYSITRHTLGHKDGKIVWEARHNAYLTKWPHAEIRRCVSWDPGAGELVLDDQIIQKERVGVDLFFHLHPDCRAVQAREGIMIEREGVTLHLCSAPFLFPEMIRGSAPCAAGWYSPDYNVLVPTTTIRYSGKIQGNTRLSSRICLSNTGQHQRR